MVGQRQEIDQRDLLRAKRPWHSLYGIRIRVEDNFTNNNEDRELSLVEKLLPEEMILLCFHHLPITSIAAARCVCKQWNAIGNSPSLWRSACYSVFCNETPSQTEIILSKEYQGSWKNMYLDRPHLRFDGVYVSRNTYIRTGIPEWKVKNPVHIVCYFRYIRFLQNGTILYRTSPQTLAKVAKSLQSPSRNDLVQGKGDSKLFMGRYKIKDNLVLTAVKYPNSTSTEVRSRLHLRSTVRGAFNRLDIQSIVSYDQEDGHMVPMIAPSDSLDEDPIDDTLAKREYRRGTEPYVFVPWENCAASILNLPVSEMDVFIAG